ncbi:MAG: hypothetical protein JWQ66_2373 [Mucilaginibacter sp.]|nr:hypothetical protein [Mucilaginibacter sp.]
MKQLSGYQASANNFNKQAAVLNKQFHLFCYDNGIRDIRRCFDIVPAHGSFGLPCFMLTFNGKYELPEDVKIAARKIFHQCFSTYNKSINPAI